MSDSDALNVWSNRRLVGQIWQNSIGQIGFRYDQAWLSESGFPLSISLPIGTAEFEPESELADRFFTNLLPEGLAREQIIRDLKIADSNYELLRAIGGECAGAISILEVHKLPVTEEKYFRLSNKDLKMIARHRGQVYTLKLEHRPRLSLAGVQNKCAVLIEKGKYWLPENDSPTNHILKFEMTEYRNVLLYETFTTLLAHNAELPVCNVKLHTIAGTSYILIERYDRKYDRQGHLFRLHQEDFCQALGRGFESKYQENDGVTFADCYRLLQNVSSDPTTDLRLLINWQVFNVLAGNSDGHAKNLSLLYHPGGEIRLAPFYDLICTRAIKRLDPRLALAVGAERNPSVISNQHWEVMAQQCNISTKFIIQAVSDMACRLLAMIPSTMAEFENRYGSSPALQRVEHIVQKQCRQAMR